jgi:hypothetical protein
VGGPTSLVDPAYRVPFSNHPRVSSSIGRHVNPLLPRRTRLPDSQFGERRGTSFAGIDNEAIAVGRAMLLAVVIFTGLSLAAPAQQTEFIDREPEIKAAYLYNFARYVEWPAAAGRTEFVIGVIGETRVAAPLATIAGSKKVNNKPISIRRFRTAKDFQQCNMLFVPTGQDPILVTALLKKAGESATLVVGEDPLFAQKQGHIGFYVDQNSVKFEINSGSAQKSALKISSKLLSLGKIVGERPAN